MSAAILINNKADAVVFRDPVAPNAHETRYWAERGQICAEDLVTGAFWSITVKEALERIKAINDMIGNSRSGKGAQRPDEMAEYSRFVDGMIVVCETARDQGMPDDPRHARQIIAEHVAKRTSRMTVLPGFNASF